MKRFLCTMLMVCLFTVPALAATYYAAPGGTGTGKTIDSPSTVVSAVALCGSGGTVQLADGTYTGPASMISLYAKENIVVRAANDGAVLIDGEGVRQPVYLNKCVRVTVEGLDACNSSQAVVEAVYSYGCTFRRICAWDAHEGNNVVLTAHWSSLTTFEDCAGWGRGRKIMTNSQNCNGTRFVRCWGRWEGCESVGPKHVYEGNYNSYNCRFINCIGTWDTSFGRMRPSYTLLAYDGTPWKGAGAGTYTYAQSAYGIFAEAGYYAEYENTYAGTQFLGCMAYQLPEQTGNFEAGFFVSRLNGITIRNCHSSIKTKNKTALLAANDRQLNRGVGLTLNRFAGYGGSVRIDKEWTPLGVCDSMPLPQKSWALCHEGDATADGVVDVGDLGVLSANWGRTVRFVGSWQVGDFNRDGHVDVGDMGILSSHWDTAKPLWPWPMESRIAQAMLRGGYPAISVTKQVEQAFGEQLVEEPPVSTTTTIYPVAGGMVRYIKSADLALGQTWAQIHANTGGLPASASEILPGYIKSARSSEDETAEIQRCGYRFDMAAAGLEGKTIEGVSFQIDLQYPGDVSGEAQVLTTSLLTPLTNTANYGRCLSEGTGRGTLNSMGGTLHTVALPAVYSATLDVAVMENPHDYANNGAADHENTVMWEDTGDSRPRLVVTWSEPAPAGPPAGSMSLLGVGR